MNALNLIDSIRNKGIALALTVGNDIKAFPSSELTNELRNLIKENKRLLFTALCQEQEELKFLISQTSKNYGGDDDRFLLEYINDILMHGDIEKSLACFRDLARQGCLLKTGNNRR